MKKYIQENIIPRYDSFDAAHRRDHVETVINQSLEIAENYDVNIDMVYAIAAYHDCGLCNGRENHHLDSGTIIRNDKQLAQWFNADEIETMAQAAEDHRASNSSAPRSIYGLIVAEADRVIDAATIVGRAIQYGLAHYPGLSRGQQIERAAEHLKEKYGDGGYMKLWIADSPNARRLEHLRTIIRDESALKALCTKVFDRLDKK